MKCTYSVGRQIGAFQVNVNGFDVAMPLDGIASVTFTVIGSYCSVVILCMFVCFSSFFFLLHNYFLFSASRLVFISIVRSLFF